MSAPVIDRRSAAGAPRDAGARRGGTLAPPRIPPRIPAQRTPDRGPLRERSAASARRAQLHAGRAKFVLVVMTLLVCGLVATLWLSTAAAADSYRLQEARTRAGTLTEQSEQLRKQVTAMDSPAALAERARAQGLVPVRDPARLVVAPDGRVDVVGEPTAARPADPPPPPAPAPGAPAPQSGAQSAPQEAPQEAQQPGPQSAQQSGPQSDPQAAARSATQAGPQDATEPAQTADPAAAAGATTAGATRAGGEG